MIRATKDSIGIVSPKLEKRIRQACRVYYPDGTLTIGKVAFNQPNAARYSQFQPSNPTLPAVLIVSNGENITDFGLLYPDRSKSIEIVKKTKAELIRQHEAGEFKYWD